MDLYEYLIHNAEKEFNRENMKAFKSLKAYKYFKDHLVRNVWVHNEEQWQPSGAIVSPP